MTLPDSVVAMFEQYLQSWMRDICSSSNDPIRVPSRFDQLFEIHSRMSDVLDLIGPAESSAQCASADLPASLRGSIEHRFQLLTWPKYEFVICQSIEGHAWWHRFDRAHNAITPSIHTHEDLGMWSHTLNEVTHAVGPAIWSEGWCPWTSALYQIRGVRVWLCFVFELLQSVQLDV